ncbi:MAG: carbohydrate-binding family 9-like protein [Planctomycetales bacterium]
MERDCIDSGHGVGLRGARCWGSRRIWLAIGLIVGQGAFSRLALAADESRFQPPVYEMHRVESPITIDGKLDEPAWFAAPDVGEFHFTWYKEGRRERTVAKLLWDDEHLYVAHVCEDAHITARHKDHDGNIPEDDCFEVIFAPDPGRPEVYFNIEWNVVGGYVDNHRPEGPKKPRAKVWDAEGVRVAGSFVGTLNDDSDTDRSWTAEVAIPLKNFQKFMPHTPPRPGEFWNLNLNRHGGKTNMQYSQWSSGDTPAPSFHTPHRFGKAIFSAKVSPFAKEGP